MGDLEYSVDLLSTLGTSLKHVSSDLKDGQGSHDYSAAQVGHDKVAGALDNFRGNWDDNREHLAKKLAALGDLATTAADGFSKADADLAHKIRASMEKR
jgi:hypothetical protein